jgi:hypothetical protein
VKQKDFAQGKHEAVLLSFGPHAVNVMDPSRQSNWVRIHDVKPIEFINTEALDFLDRA